MVAKLMGTDMIYGLWTFTIMYSLGFILLQAITAPADDGDPNADIKLALLWPYVAVRVIIERILYGPDTGEDK